MSPENDSVSKNLFHETAASASLASAEELSKTALKGIRSNPSKYRVLTGERPTGPLHIGHYFGSLKRRVELQSLGVETWLVIADYQALTDRVGSPDLQEAVKNIVLDYLAIGLDVLSDKGVAFCHSQIPELNQLLLPFLSLVTVSEIERNPTVKSEMESMGITSMSGLMFNYPVHQAADILFCHGNIVPGGRDQLPHVEIARRIARKFNTTYCGDRPYFEEPTLLFGDAPMLLGTDGRKMGKSLKNAIFIRDDETTTAALLKKAVTDSEKRITYEPVRRPEVSNLLLIASCCTGRTPESIAEEIGDRGGSALKTFVTDAVNTYFSGIREKRRAYEKDPDIVRKVLARGTEIAREMAHKTITEVHKRMFLDYGHR
jgi:tryptophanyl-tRNA synthetase